MVPKFSSVAQSRLALCDPMDCSTPGFPVHHQLPEFTQIHVHRVGDGIQPSYPLTSPFPPDFNFSQHQGFSSESVLCIRWTNYWSFSFSISPPIEYSGLISFRIELYFNLKNIYCILNTRFNKISFLPINIKHNFCHPHMMVYC